VNVARSGWAGGNSRKLILFKATQYSQNMKHDVFHSTIPTVCSEHCFLIARSISEIPKYNNISALDNTTATLVKWLLPYS